MVPLVLWELKSWSTSKKQKLLKGTWGSVDATKIAGIKYPIVRLFFIGPLRNQLGYNQTRGSDLCTLGLTLMFFSSTEIRQIKQNLATYPQNLKKINGVKRRQTGIVVANTRNQCPKVKTNLLYGT
ncbi:hypothetical protein V6N12_051556 [Hibiscus sabdariffa]|uniref:Uncharacterized protein n=1 Tax=Hibiscus sabdariffa TaxID=183260 RepID=A0ABR2GHI9_9ROSI